MLRMVTTRPAQAADARRVLVLLGQLLQRNVLSEPAYGRAFERMLETERGVVILAEEEGQVLGIISVSFNLALRYAGNYAQIEELVVDETARGKQVGAILARAAVQEAIRQGCSEIGLYARDETRGFYEKLGFTPAGTELRRRLRAGGD